MRKKILTVVGTRPNFIKITQFEKEFAKYPDEFEFRLLHTGQHYDKAMSQVFFDQLNLSEPDYYLGIPPAKPSTQMGEIMIRLTKIIEDWQPDLLVVVGDVNSTFASALVANKLKIKFAHVESGLRSLNLNMPEEINRIFTDQIADVFFVTEQSGLDNLLAEGHSEKKIHFVGNTMIDTLVAFDKEIQESSILEDLGVSPDNYYLMTMHRPMTVDFPDQLKKLIALITFIGKRAPVVFPVHPRTLNNLDKFGMREAFDSIEGLITTGPLDYLAFQKLISKSKAMITDSGGIQEETTFRLVPCLTLRPETERPSTITLGTNELIDFDLTSLEERIIQIEQGTFKKGQIPPLWDGKATQRIVESVRNILSTKG